MMSLEVIIRQILERLHDLNKNWLVVILGPTGSGKSWASLRLAELIDKEFGIENVAFGIEELLNILNRGVRQGQCIVMEETGISASNRQWQSQSNRIMNFIAQSFRSQNLAVIFNTPNFNFIDSQLRSLFHGMVKTQFIEKKNSLCIVKIYELKIDEETGKQYKYFYSDDDGVKIELVGIGKPSNKLIVGYEKRKKEFVEGIQKDADKNIKKEKKKEILKIPNATCQRCGYMWSTNAMKPRCPGCDSSLIDIEKREIS